MNKLKFRIVKHQNSTLFKFASVGVMIIPHQYNVLETIHSQADFHNFIKDGRILKRLKLPVR